VSAHISAGERISVSVHLLMLATGTLKLEVVLAWSYSKCHATRVVFSMSRIN
jgi:hypothetical protein